MEPYQEAAQASRRSGELPLNAVKFGSMAALGGLATKAVGPLIGRILPFLNDFIPDDLSKKGLNKIDPRFGKFINKAEEQGWSYPEVRDYLSQKAQKTKEDIFSHSSKPGGKNKNLIEKHSPELHQFISEYLQKGNSPLQAAALSQSDPDKKGFGAIIKKIAKENKASWADIVEGVYGGQVNQQQQAPNQPTPGNQPPIYYDYVRPDQVPQQGQPQQGQVGPGQQAFMALLQKINQRLGK